MLNPIETYIESGRRAGIARNRGDESAAKFEQDWMRRAISLEGEDKGKAESAWRGAYREIATPSRPKARDT